MLGNSLTVTRFLRVEVATLALVHILMLIFLMAIVNIWKHH